MATTTAKSGPKERERFHHLTREESRALFDRVARRDLNMSGEEFLRAWDAGEFDDNPDRPEVIRVAMLRRILQ